MALQFIFGNSKSNKSTYIFEKIIKESLENPRINYYVIVPEQFTMETQKKLCNLHPSGGIMNIDVLSFGRLAHRVSHEVGGENRILLDDTGKNLILRRIAGKNVKDLAFLKSNILKRGYITEVKSVLSEFGQYGMGIEELEDVMEKLSHKSSLYLKLKDIKKISEDFNDYLSGQYITSEELLDVLSEQVKDSKKIKDSVILFEGFTGFTPVQNRLIGELLKVCKEVMITVTVDEREDSFVYNTPYQLFALPKKMVTSLVKIAGEGRVKVTPPIYVSRKNSSLVNVARKNLSLVNVAKEGSSTIDVEKEVLNFLERNIFRNHKVKYREPVKSIFLNVVRNPNFEADVVVSKIRELIRCGISSDCSNHQNQGDLQNQDDLQSQECSLYQGYPLSENQEGGNSQIRLRDIAVILPDMNVYGPSFIRAFDRYNIKYFMDDKKSVMLNSFVDYIRTLLDMISSGFTYESVFRLLRTGLFAFSKEEVDLLDNYVRATGIRGFSRWKSPWINTTREGGEEELEQLNSLRVKFVETLEPLVFVLTQKSKNVMDITLALHDFFVQEKIQEQLQRLEEELQRKGELALAKEYAQIYRIVMDCFDQIVEFLGEEKLPLLEYQKILEAGFEEARVGVIPPTLDQVIVGDIQRTRIDEAKVIFLVGANDVAIPGNPGKGGLLSDEEREWFANNNYSLSPTAKEQIFIQKYYLYLALTKASDQLHISYSKSTTDGKPLRSSYLINEIRKLFPAMKVADMDELTLENREITPEVALGALAYGLANRKYALSESWSELYTSYLNSEDIHHEKLEKIIKASFLTNDKGAVEGENILSLYGDLEGVSVSRLERFVTCPYQHFLTYGLKIREREEYGFESVDYGVIAHHAMENFSKRAKELGQSWNEMDIDTKNRLIEESVDLSVKDYGNQILYSSQRYKYMIARIKKTLLRSVWGLSKQMEKSKFNPYELEMAFAGGRIDRVDICENEGKIYVKVMDYKTGSKTVDITSLYHGLQLQLPVYLIGATEMLQGENPDKEVVPAGFMYFQIQDPLVREKGEARSIDQALLEKLQPSGIINGEEEVVELMERDYLKGSPLLPINGNHVSREDLDTLLEYTRVKVNALKEKMKAGDIQVKPYKLKQDTGCKFCKYGTICGFDTDIEGYAYDHFPTIEKKNGIAMMREELENVKKMDG